MKCKDIFVDVANERNVTPLIISSGNGSVEAVKDLIEAGGGRREMRIGTRKERDDDGELRKSREGSDRERKGGREPPRLDEEDGDVHGGEERARRGLSNFDRVECSGRQGECEWGRRR